MQQEDTGYFCLYDGPAREADATYGGSINLKTKQGFAIAVFPTRELAEYFASVFKIPARPIPLLLLATEEFPQHPRGKLPKPRKKMLFSSKGVLSAWAADRQGFDTAPYVSAL